MKTLIKNSILILTVIILASCVSAKKHGAKVENFHVAAVDVNMPGQTSTHKFSQYTDGFGHMLTNTISRYGTEYNATRPNATQAYKLTVNIEKVHFKNPVASLLVGDANYINGQAILTDPGTGSVIQKFPIKYVDGASAALNGISGAVLSVVVKKNAAEGTLSRGVARNLMKLLYPRVKLASASEKRLKGKTVFEPMTTAMSPLSTGISDAIETAADNSAEPAS